MTRRWQELLRGQSTRARSAADVHVPASPANALTYFAPATAAQWLASLAAVSEVGAYKRLSYQLLDLHPGWRVLDVGCGIGDDVFALAGIVAPDGAVTGVDANPSMIEAAAMRLPDALGTSTGSVSVQFEEASVEQMPFHDASFDAVRVDRVLQHVAIPRAALDEIRRVLRPGGHVVVIEPDWRTMAVYPGGPAGGDDDTIIATIFDWQVARTPHATIGRQLRSLLVDSGFEEIQVHPVAYKTYRFAEADLVLELSATAELAVAAEPPLLSEEEVRGWLEAARLADAEGRFLACVPLMFARGRRSRRRRS